jgi:branched-chain amino acid transport system ATP-binding protein
MGERLRLATGGTSLAPLVLLFALNLVDEFDRIAFGVLTPNIRDAFHLSDGGIIAIGSVAAVVALFGALPVGYLADRRDRTALVRWSGLLWMAMAILTGAAPTLALLVIARIGAGVAHVAAEPLHASLLGDFYRPVTHPRVFAIHRLANPVSGVAAIVIGAGAIVWGWRPIFFVVAIPTAVLAIAAGRLREPRRGETVDAAMAALAAESAPISFGEARRQLLAIRTLRRIWLASFFIGLAVIPIGQFLSLFFEKVYGFDALARGVVSFVLGLSSVAGLAVGERVATSATEAGRVDKLPIIIGASFSLFGAGLLAMVVAPWASLSLLLGGIGLVGLGAVQPAYYALIGLVAPPRVRAQAYAYALVIAGTGGLFAGIFGGIGERSGYRVGIGILAVVLVASGGLQASARRWANADARQARLGLASALEVLGDEHVGPRGRPILACRAIEVAYDQVQVLFGVDLDVFPGEIVALLGTNGAGKSTLLNAVCGIVPPLAGTTLFDGVDITRAGPAGAARAGIVVVPGGKAVFPTLTVAEHFRAASWLFRTDKARVDASLEIVLREFPRLRERLDHPAGNLSGGEQQMLALGMAFIAKPKLLMIDELSLGLAPVVVEQLLKIVRRIQADGTAIVIVEQSLNVALSLAERAYFLEKGEVRFEGLTRDLAERDDIVRSVFLRATDHTRSDATSVDARSEAPTLLEVSGLRKSFGGVHAVTGTELVVGRGETVGLIGPNGAGKTTVFDLISGFLTADAGTIVFDGVDVTDWSPDRRAMLELGRSFQDARLVPSITVAENIAIALDRHLELRDHLASLLHLPAVVEIEEDVAWSVHDLIELTNLGAYRDKLVRELSTGTRRIVDLAMCIGHRPKLLLLDEPSSGIAQRETEALAPLLQRIKHETGCALLLIEHDMPLISEISDRLIALELGRPICEGTPLEVTSDPRVIASYLGGDPTAINRSGRAPGGSGSRGARRRREPLRAGAPS